MGNLELSQLKQTGYTKLLNSTSLHILQSSSLIEILEAWLVQGTEHKSHLLGDTIVLG